MASSMAKSSRSTEGLLGSDPISANTLPNCSSYASSSGTVSSTRSLQAGSAHSRSISNCAGSRDSGLLADLQANSSWRLTAAAGSPQGVAHTHQAIPLRQREWGSMEHC